MSGTSRLLRRMSATNGIVNLLNAERNDHLLVLCSGDGDGIAPLGHRRSPEGPVRRCRDQVSLDVEGVVDGGVC